MRHRIVTCLTPNLIAASLFLAIAAFGQTAEPAEATAEAPENRGPSKAGERLEAPELTRELAKLNATLDEIRSLLERVTETQGLDLMMKRMELSSAQAADLEKRFDGLESERAAIEDTMRQIESNREAYLADIESRGDDESLLQAEAFTAQADRELAVRSERLRALDDEIAVLRNRLDAKRRELEDWQGYVDRRLGGA